MHVRFESEGECRPFRSSSGAEVAGGAFSMNPESKQRRAFVTGLPVTFVTGTDMTTLQSHSDSHTGICLRTVAGKATDSHLLC